MMHARAGDAVVAEDDGSASEFSFNEGEASEGEGEVPGWKAVATKTSVSGNSTYLVDFKRYLGSIAGGSKGEREIGMTASIVLRFMRFAARRVLQPAQDNNNNNNNNNNALPPAVKADSKIFKNADKVLQSVPQYTHWITHLDEEQHAAPATIRANLNRVRRYVEYRIGLLSGGDDASVAHVSRYQIVLHALLQHGRNLSKLIRKDQGIKLSQEALSERGEWCSLTEIVSAFRLNQPRFTRCIDAARRTKSMDYESKRFCLQITAAACYVLCSPARAGFWTGITLQTFLDACASPGRVLTSQKFKTSGTYGYQSVIITKPLEDMMLGYTEHVRPYCGTHGPVSNTLLVGVRSGKALSGTAGILKQFFQHALGVNLHSTRLRQILHTGAVNEFDAKEVAVFERGDTHSGAVARQHYLKESASTVAFSAGSLQRRLVQNSTSSPRPAQVTTSITSGVKNELLEVQQDAAVIDVSSDSECSREDRDISNDNTKRRKAVAITPLRTPSEVKRKRTCWTKDEVVFINDFVQDHKRAKVNLNGGIRWNWALAVKLGHGILQPKHRNGVAIKDCHRNIVKGTYNHFLTK